MSTVSNASDTINRFSRMIRKTGGPATPGFWLEENSCRSAYLKCRNCKSTAACNTWLDSMTEAEQAPGFCVNSAWMNRK